MNPDTLSFIVRKVQTPVRPGPADHVVLLDSKTYEPVKSDGWFKRLDRYFVTTAPDLDGQPVVTRAVQVQVEPDMHNRTGQTPIVTITYRIACLEQEQAVELAGWCAREQGNFEAKLDAVVRRWAMIAIEKAAKEGLQTDSPGGWLVAELNGAARAEKLGLSFRFEAKVPIAVENQIVGEKPLKAVIRLQNYDRPVEISIRLRLRCENPFRYFKAGSPDLEQWVTKEVVKHVEDEMWGTKYGTFLHGFEENQRKVRATLEKRGRDLLGYSITNLLTEPITPEFELLERFQIAQELPCPTRRPEQEVIMRLRFEGRLRDLESTAVRKLMATPADGDRNIIKAALERELLDQMKVCLRGVALEDLLQSIHFETLEKAQKLVQRIPWDSIDNHTALLRTRLEKVLKDFHAEGAADVASPHLVVELLGDPVERAFEAFKKTPFTLNGIAVLNFKTGRHVSLQIIVTAESVVPGQIGTFLSRGHSHDRATIETALRDYLSSLFQTLPERALRFDQSVAEEDLRLVITIKLNEFTKSTYGIETYVAAVKRESSQLDVAHATALEEAEGKARLEERKGLLEARGRLREKEIEAQEHEADRWITERPYAGDAPRSPEVIRAKMQTGKETPSEADDEAWNRMVRESKKTASRALPENRPPSSDHS